MNLKSFICAIGLTLAFSGGASGCAFHGGFDYTPETFKEKLASGYVTVTAVRTTTASLLASQAITKSDAQNVQNQADVARAGLDAARDLEKMEPVVADNKVNASLQVLKALQAYLLTRSAK